MPGAVLLAKRTSQNMSGDRRELTPNTVMNRTSAPVTFPTTAMPRILFGVLLAYAGASALHFIHNAVFLNSYPNMPDWISPGGVFGALASVTAIGILGYLLFVVGFRIAGLIVIGVYAAFGFDGLAHYSLAPVSEHTTTMNLTIWLEVATATLLMSIVFWLITGRFSIVVGRSKSDA